VPAGTGVETENLPDRIRSIYGLEPVLRDDHVILIGWLLFIVSAIGFIIASWGEFWPMFGSVFFLLACLVFLIPFVRRR